MNFFDFACMFKGLPLIGQFLMLPFLGVVATVTKVTDVVTPEVWAPYFIERTAEKSSLIASGIVGTDAVIAERVNGGGRLIDMPFWTDLTGDDEALQDDADLTPGKIETSQDQAVKLYRGRAIGANDLAKYLAGDDPAAAIADLFAEYWNRREQAILLAVLKGIFADNTANDSGDMSSDISIADGANATAANLISGEAVIDAVQTMGDAKDMLTAMMIHSVVEARLAKNDLIEYERDSTGTITKRTFMGLNVLVNDNCPKDAGDTGYKYTTYIFGAGAIAREDATLPADETVELQREALASETYMVTRRHMIMHPRGIKWTDSVVSNTSPKNPSNADLYNASNWDRVYERKNVRIARLVTNG